MGRGARTKVEEVAERRCIATLETLPKPDLIRFVLGPDDLVTPDVAERLPGRGIWVSAQSGALEKAIAQNLFSKAAKKKAVIPENLVELTTNLIAQRTINMISMARKSGHAICGFEKVKSAVMSEQGHVLIQALDGSDGQKRKIRPQNAKNSYISWLTAQELGLAFGRESVIHAAVSKGGLSARILLEANRLVGFRGKHDDTGHKTSVKTDTKG